MTRTTEPDESARDTDVDRPSSDDHDATASPLVEDGWRLAWILSGVLAVFYAWFAVMRHERLMTSGYDLGIFEQEVRSYAHLHWPTSTLKGPDFKLLGDHFSPAMAVLAPFYRLFPSAVTLLIAQALLVALGAAPLVAWAQRRAGTASAVTVGISYGLSWGVAEAIGFDVHEVMLAVPLIAFSAVALGERRLVAAVCWIAPIVLVKEDLGLTVAAVGVFVACCGRVRLGAVTAAFGLFASWLATYVIIPAVSPSGSDGYYTDQVHLSWSTVQHLLQPETKITTVLMLLAPTAFLAVRSPIVLLIVPTLGWRFAADNPAYWGTTYHYSLVLMPIVFAAMIDALARTSGRTRWAWLAGSLAVTLVVLPNHLFSQTPSLLRADPRADRVHRLLDRIPSDVTVSASDWLAPQLTGRDDVSLFGYTPLTESRAQYVVVDTAPKILFPLSLEDTMAQLAQAQASGYRLVDEVDNVVLLQRTG